eukprot:2489222-Amphidinium_carterae.2
MDIGSPSRSPSSMPSTRARSGTCLSSQLADFVRLDASSDAEHAIASLIVFCIGLDCAHSWKHTSASAAGEQTP